MTDEKKAEVAMEVALTEVSVKLEGVERRLDEGLQTVGARLNGINQKLDEKYVTQDQFQPVRSIVFGMVGAMLLAILFGLLALVFNSPKWISGVAGWLM